MVWLPSTFAHEVAHLVAGFIVRAKPVQFSVLPQRVPGTNDYRLGHVLFERLTWWKALPVATAPLYLLAPLGWLILQESLPASRLEEVLISCYAALQCFAGAWPSREDWAQARRTIWGMLLIGGVFVALVLSQALNALPFPSP